MDYDIEEVNLPPPDEAISKRKGLHWLFAAPLSLWCLFWLLINGYSYIGLTWNLFRNLGWLSFALLINPCFFIWCALFSSAVWAPLNLLFLPWGKYDGELSRTKTAMLVFFVPFILALVLTYIGPYFYPITVGAEDRRIFLRFIPILGGQGF